MSLRTHATPVLSPILGGYIARRFAAWVIGAFFLVGFVIYLIELVDLLRRSTNLANMSFGDVALLAGYRVPAFVELAAPILIVVAAIGCLWWMTRSHELTVMRSTGTSFFQFARPMFTMALVLGLAIVLVISPLAIALSQAYDRALASFSGASANATSLTVSATQSGLWISDRLPNDGRVIVKAESRAPGDRIDLSQVTLFELDPRGNLLTSLQADQALLSEGGLLTLLRVSRLEGDGTVTQLPDRSYQTALNRSVFEAAEAERLLPTFWNLASTRFADVEAEANESRYSESAQRLQLTWHKFLSFPLLLSLSVALAATFSMRMSRSGKTGLFIGVALLFAIGFHFLRDILFALSLTGNLTPPIAIWSPILAVAALCFLTLSMSEDG